MRVEVVTACHATDFGGPAASRPESRCARQRAVLVLERLDYPGFIKLTAALHAGFLVCATGCVMHVTPTPFAPRISLLVAPLFSLAFGMRAASLALGSEHRATLIDRLHMTGLAAVAAVTAVTALIRIRLETSTE